MSHAPVEVFQSIGLPSLRSWIWCITRARKRVESWDRPNTGPNSLASGSTTTNEPTSGLSSAQAVHPAGICPKGNTCDADTIASAARAIRSGWDRCPRPRSSWGLRRLNAKTTSRNPWTARKAAASRNPTHFPQGGLAVLYFFVPPLPCVSNGLEVPGRVHSRRISKNLW